MAEYNTFVDVRKMTVSVFYADELPSEKGVRLICYDNKGKCITLLVKPTQLLEAFNKFNKVNTK